jgi:hypothetical protein
MKKSKNQENLQTNKRSFGLFTKIIQTFFHFGCLNTFTIGIFLFVVAIAVALFGVIYLTPFINPFYLFYNGIKNIFQYKYDNTDLINKSLEVSKIKLQKIVQFQSKLSAINWEIKDSFKITINEIEDERYKDWDGLVKKSKLITRKIDNITRTFDSIYDKNKAFNKRWLKFIASYNKDNFVDVAKITIKGLKRIGNEEQNEIKFVRSSIEETYQDLSDFQEISKNRAIEYKDLLKVSREGWEMKDIFKNYGTAAFGLFLPAKIVNGFTGTAITYALTNPPVALTVGVMGVVGMMAYHVRDRLSIQPANQKVYKKLISRFNTAVDVAKLTEIYLVRYKSHMNSIHDKMQNALDNLEKLRKRNNFEKFINEVNQDFESLNEAFSTVLKEKVKFEDKIAITPN